jgi:ribosomal protein S18 acetylase RimI-like enzyme
MFVETATAMDVSALADAWVALAREQRAHDSHLLATENRARIRESMAHHVVEDTCLVARPDDCDADGDANGEANADSGGNVDADAEADGGATGARFLGFVTFTVDETGYELDVSGGTVENLYVDPEHRGHGIGAALLAAAESELADRGVDVVSLEVLANNERAREFYDRVGYGDHRVVLEKRVDVETDTKGNRGE